MLFFNRKGAISASLGDVGLTVISHRESSSSQPQRVHPTRIPIGTYQFVNVETAAYAGLLDDNDNSEVVNLRFAPDEDHPLGSEVNCFHLVYPSLIAMSPCQWLVTNIGGDEYKIENTHFKSYASYHPSPQHKEYVIGKWHEIKEWRIRVVAQPNVCM
jgi:hypothetical protein